MKLEGTVFVVTGGASGLGEACVRMAVANNGKAAIFDMNPKKGDAIVEELGADNVIFKKVNVTSEKDVDEALAAVVEKFGRVDVVVNSAGVGGALPIVNRKGDAHPMGAFQRILDINLKGTFIVASKAAAIMAKQEANNEGERGLIVNIASVAAMDGQNGQSAYSASKAGVQGMALPMARDLGKFGIRVNTICPGFFDTAMTGAKKPVEFRDVAKLNKVQVSLLSAQLFPNTRFGRPSEIALLVKAMTEIPFFNGESVRLDAGIRMPKL
eukprot:TRINITY_DN65297_c0_g1_i1.p2 TRINITY_DN65297_c0_g1~~TRINITY_DN65297_c0_g1_i1.p2  ORF type:complete len:289 (+),score=131.84 TRINITY_DN65297_c0_g1_i1:63-869(+)